MRKWAIVITAFYALVVLFLGTFGAFMVVTESLEVLDIFDGSDSFGEVIIEYAFLWITIFILVCSQALLMFLSVDISWRRLKPQRHARVTAGLVGLMILILLVAVVFAVSAAYSGDSFWPGAWLLQSLPEISQLPVALLAVVLIWAGWGALFYTFSKRVSNVVDAAVSWLIRGSVLELLIAVPCHLIIRQRSDCCAPLASAYGIATGIAVMLMAFGPSALFLYKRKLDDYRQKSKLPSE
jgi:hypothetical protein